MPSLPAEITLATEATLRSSSTKLHRSVPTISTLIVPPLLMLRPLRTWARDRYHDPENHMALSALSASYIAVLTFSGLPSMTCRYTSRFNPCKYASSKSYADMRLQTLSIIALKSSSYFAMDDN